MLCKIMAGGRTGWLWLLGRYLLTLELHCCLLIHYQVSGFTGSSLWSHVPVFSTAVYWERVAVWLDVETEGRSGPALVS